MMSPHYPDLGSASDWLCREGIFFRPIRSTTKIWVVHVTSMEFLRLLLRRRFARAQEATSRNVSCFLRLDKFHHIVKKKTSLALRTLHAYVYVMLLFIVSFPGTLSNFS